VQIGWSRVLIYSPLAAWIFCSLSEVFELLTAPEHVAEPRAPRRVVCYPVQLTTAAPPPSTVVERKEQNDLVLLTYKSETHRISSAHFHKLVRLLLNR
jgi:hypothetical protein